MLKTYYQILQKSINYLNKDELTIDNLIDRYNKLSSNEIWEIFEYYSCIKYNLVQWNHISFDTKDWLYDNFGITRDYGIDGLSEDKKISLQSKYRNGTNITFREASTFFGLSSILKCEKMILSTLNDAKIDKIVNNFKFEIDKIDKEQFIKDIANDVYNNFSKFGGKDERKEEVKLRPYQEKAIKKFEKHIKQKKKQINIQMTCAAGKSFVIQYFIDKFLELKKKSENILILVPTILLADHINKLLEKFNPIVYHNKAKLENEENKILNVYICVYNSIQRLVKKVKHFDLVIVDEGHHLDKSVKKDTYRKTIQNLNVNYKLNLSATFHNETKLDYEYSIKKGINQGYINDYSIVIPWFKESKELREKIKNIENGKWDNEECIEIVFEGGEGNEEKEIKIKKNEMYTKKREFLQPMVFDSLADLLTRRIDMMWVLAYCNNIPESKKFVESLNKKGISAVHMDGKMSVKERHRILRKFEKGEYRVLSSVAVLGEGIDLNFVDTVMFVSPRYSFINITQCIGRCLRKKNKKSNVVFPHVVEEAALEKFLIAMTKNDDRIIKGIKNGIK
jgi:superfamily II DNA or RNA helicase